MQYRSKKAVAVGVLALAVVLAGGGAVAQAKSDHAGSQGKSVETGLKKKVKAPKLYKRTIPGKIVSITPGTTTTTQVTDPTTGAVSNVTTTSYLNLVIQKGNKQYTVRTTASTQTVDRKWRAIAQTELKVGHKVTVKGMLNKSTMIVDATWVRDVSLPVPTTSTTQ